QGQAIVSQSPRTNLSSNRKHRHKSPRPNNPRRHRVHLPTLWIRGIVNTKVAIEWQRMRELMNQYSDMPLDCADASLISAAEVREDRKLFSLDGPLRAVRLDGSRILEFVP